MTAGTRIMRFRGSTYKRIIMAASTAGCTYRNAGMAGIRCMHSIPRTRMTGGTVGRARITYGRTDQHAAAGIMTAGTSVVRFRGCAYKRIIMAVGTAGCTHRDTGMAISGCRMNCAPGACMTGGTVGRGRIADGGAD